MAKLRQSFIRALQLNKTCRCAEIGVQWGDNALAMLQAGVGSLILVDPYPDIYGGQNLEFVKKLDYMKQGVVSKVKGFRTEILLMTSVAGAEYTKYLLDYVYIDADHSYEAVKKDIEVWLPKVSKGGILGGHDYDFKSVKKAVDECFGDKVCSSRFDSDWWVEC